MRPGRARPPLRFVSITTALNTDCVLAQRGVTRRMYDHVKERNSLDGLVAPTVRLARPLQELVEEFCPHR